MYECTYCGCPTFTVKEHGQKYHKSGFLRTLDHFYPKCMSNKKRKSRVKVISCATCNQKKRALHPLLWAKSVPRYGLRFVLHTILECDKRESTLKEVNRIWDLRGSFIQVVKEPLFNKESQSHAWS